MDELAEPEALYSWEYNGSMASLQTAEDVVSYVLLAECYVQFAALARTSVTSQVGKGIG